MIVIPHHLLFNKTTGEDSVDQSEWNQDDQVTQKEATQDPINRAVAIKFTAV